MLYDLKRTIELAFVGFVCWHFPLPTEDVHVKVRTSVVFEMTHVAVSFLFYQMRTATDYFFLQKIKTKKLKLQTKSNTTYFFNKQAQFGSKHA